MTTPPDLNHEFDSSRTCNYCGIAAERVQGIAENGLCPVRQKQTAAQSTTTDFSKFSDRELDAWIAEHVFGFRWAKWPDASVRCLYPPSFLDGYPRPSVCDSSVPICTMPYIRVPAYSTDHALAHALGVRMAEMGLAFEYALELTCMIAGTTEPCTAKDLFDLTQATTRQRSEAAARVVEAAELRKREKGAACGEIS